MTFGRLKSFRGWVMGKETIPYRGAQGLFNVPDEVVRAAIGKLDAAVIE